VASVARRASSSGIRAYQPVTERMVTSRASAVGAASASTSPSETPLHVVRIAQPEVQSRTGSASVCGRLARSPNASDCEEATRP
jgi:hypothetical protein